MFKHKTKWLFVILTQATGGHYIEVSSEEKNQEGGTFVYRTAFCE